MNWQLGKTFLFAQVTMFCFFLDVEKRDNPVCHFVTPLDGTIEFDEPRKPEVSECETPT